MKTIGLIGGMSWESTIPYYRIINEEVRKRLGGLHSAKIILHSVEFDEIEQCQSNGDWDKSAQILGKAAQGLEAAGVDFILICTNTMHKVQPVISQMIHIPIIHIADTTAYELEKYNIRKVGLLGTKYTMKQEFYKQRLYNHGIEVLIPEEPDIDFINEVIFHELCIGKIENKSKQHFEKIIENLRTKGAEGVILGCTEIGMLIKQENSVLPVFDTTEIHAKCAVELALEMHAYK